ncbi:MAG: ABC transporter permease [Clostridiales bacterium]|nr:ABC transporter permease [Clostridiales bacterium]
MKRNPIYKREAMVSARSFRLALVLMIFSGILAVVALLNMYSTLAQVRLTAEIQYTSFLDLFLFITILEFAMLVLIMPAITAGSISGERERQTLELLMTTELTPHEIVQGKLMGALSTMGLLVVSGFPILGIVFVYGGVTVPDIGLLILCYMVAALFMGSLGIACSAICRKTTMATVMTYALLGFLVLGTYGINQFVWYLNGMRTDTYLTAVGQAAEQATSGGFLYLLLANPASTFLLVISGMTGREPITEAVTSWFGSRSQNWILTDWIGISLLLQVVCAALFFRVAVWAVRVRKTPARRKNRKKFTVADDRKIE